MAPPTLFVGVWTGTVGALALCGNLFYPVSVKTLLIYLVGATVFSVSGMVAATLPGRTFSRRSIDLGFDRHHYCRIVLDVLFLACLCGLPFFAHKMLDPVGGWGNPTALLEVRQNVLEASSQVTTFSGVNNLAVLARFVAFGMFYENDGTRGRKLRAYLSLPPAIAYGLLNGSKGPAVVVLITVMFLTWLKARKVDLKSAFVVGVLCIAFFSAGLLLINYAFMNFSRAGDAETRLAWVVPNYWLGGPVAFDQIVENPNAVPSTQGIDRFFLETANSLGAHFELPTRHAQFTSISDSEISSDTNVYTIYFSYYKDYGWPGVILLMALAGFCTTWVYNIALRGRPVAVVLCAMTLVGTVFSFNGEHYWLELNEYIKALIFFTLLYRGPIIRFKTRRLSVPMTSAEAVS
jgi:oligosaccharide repeat unit polymerase